MSSFASRHMKELWLLVLVIAINAPFLLQPIHFDDYGMLILARNLVKHPLTPYEGTSVFFGQELPISLNTHPPLFIYYLGVALFLNPQEDLFFLRIFMLIPTLVCTLGVLSAARRLTSTPFIATMLIMFSPCFQATTHSFLSDIFFTAFLIWSFSCLIRGVAENSLKWRFISSLLLGGACLVSYQGVLLIPILLLYELLHLRKLKLSMLFSLIPIGFLILWALHLHTSYGVLPFSSSEALYGALKHSIAGNLVAFTTFFSGAGPLPLYLLAAVVISITWRWYSAIPVVCAIISWSIFARTYSPVHSLLFICFAWSGFCLAFRALMYLWKLLPAIWKAPPDTELINSGVLASWFLLFWLGFGFFTPFIIARYTLPSIIVITFLALHELKRFSDHYRTLLSDILILLTIGLGLLVSYGDLELAQAAPRLLCQLHEQTNMLNQKIWVAGEFGMRYYLEKAGLPLLLRSGEHLQPGDLIVTSRYIGVGLPDLVNQAIYERCQRVGTLVAPSSFPIRTLNSDARAGLYCHYSGFLPWSLSSAPLDEFWIYAVAPETQSKVMLLEPAAADHSQLLETTAEVAVYPGYRSLNIRSKWLIEQKPMRTVKTQYRLKGKWREWNYEHQWKNPLEFSGIYAEQLSIPLPSDVYPGTYVFTEQLQIAELVVQPHREWSGEEIIVPAQLSVAFRQSFMEHYELKHKLTGGFSTALTPQNVVTMDFATEKKIYGIELFSRLGDAVAIEQGTKVAELILYDAKNNPLTIPIRAGVETAEWAIDRPDITKSVKHIAVPKAYTFPVEQPQPFNGYIYSAPLHFWEPLVIKGFELRMTDAECLLIIDGLYLLGKQLQSQEP